MSTADLSQREPLAAAQTSNLSSQDRKDLEKFTKYFVFKCIQVIIQSRLGVRLHSQSKHLASGSDWFNLCIRDHSEVLGESKKLYDGLPSLTNGNSVCVEISVKTVDGDEMVLETWAVDLSEESDPSTRICFTVYNRMGVVLKSLISVSRSVVGYKLSRRQGPESFVVLYRLYVGTPDTSRLGDGAKQVTIGMVPTPAGTVRLNLAYRTRLFMSPKIIPPTRDLCAELNKDHFPAEERRAVKLEDSHEAMNVGDVPAEPRLSNGISRVAAFASNNHVSTESDSSDCNSLPFGRLLDCASDIPSSDSKSENLGGVESSLERSSASQPMQVSGSLSSSKSPPPPQNHPENHQTPRQPDNFVMLELRTPFAGSDEDLGRFYRDCQAAPALIMFQQGGGPSGEPGGEKGVKHMLNSITDQLAQFEANAKEFDEFVSSIQELDVN